MCGLIDVSLVVESWLQFALQVIISTIHRMLETAESFNFALFYPLFVGGCFVIYKVLQNSKIRYIPVQVTLLRIDPIKTDRRFVSAIDVKQSNMSLSVSHNDQLRNIRNAINWAKMAAFRGNAEKCLELIKYFHLNVNYIAPDLGLSIFLSSCVSSNYNLIENLLKLGGDIKAMSLWGDSPLYLAVHVYLKHKHPYLAILHLLITSGCDVNAINHNGYTVLHLAAGKGDPELTRFLLDHGASPNVVTCVGTPLTMALATGNRDVIDLLTADR